jgi:sulfite exporter TauE/SafE
MGFILGFIGFGFSLVGIQQYVSLIAGIVMLILVVIPAKQRSFFLHASFFKMPDSLKSVMQKLLKSDSQGSMLMLGFLNGWLPCGFVYMALAGGVGMGSPSGSALFMFLFGLGTLPVMLFVSVLPGIQSLKLKQRLNTLFPYITALIALLLILRGLGLGIPFLSPDLGSDGVNMMQH